MIYVFSTELTNPLSMCDLVSHSSHAHDEHPCHERSPCGCNGYCGWVTPAKFSEYLGFEIVLFITKPVNLLSITPEKYSCQYRSKNSSPLDLQGKVHWLYFKLGLLSFLFVACYLVASSGTKTCVIYVSLSLTTFFVFSNLFVFFLLLLYKLNWKSWVLCEMWCCTLTATM